MVSISFHVRHEVRPDRVLETLQAIETSAPLDHITQVDRQLTRARALGLVQQGADKLTELGSVTMHLVRDRPALWGEIGHFLHYTLWSERKPDQNPPLFLYRTYCDYLFEQFNRVDVSRAELERTCVELVNAIESDPRFAQLVDGGLSLSPDSLRGILSWLEALRPPVLEDGVFNRRDFCAPELILLALGYVMRDELDAIDVDILLSHSRRDDICKVCLLDPVAFDRTLDWAISMYPKIIVSSEEAGYYGRYVRLLKRPELEDFLR